MRVAILGRGRMGQEVARLARAAGDEVGLELDVAENTGGAGLTPEALKDIDVAIDFTTASAVIDNVTRVAEAGKPIIVGTTGWYDQMDAVRAVVEKNGTALVHGANFSVGVHILRQLVAHAARLVDRFPEYDPYVIEHHHNAKIDAPSGTAQRLGEAIIAAVARKTHIESRAGGGAIASDALHVVSVRAGSAFGHHEVGLDSPADEIKIVHSARGREGFARGALFAAAWVLGRQGVHEFSHILEEEGS